MNRIFAVILSLALVACGGGKFTTASDSDDLSSTGGEFSKEMGGASGMVEGSGGKSTPEGSGGLGDGGSADTGGTGGSTGGGSSDGGSGGSTGGSGSGGSPSVCDPGDSQCFEGDVETCNAEGQWDTSSDCPFSCIINSNEEPVCFGECNPGDVGCEFNFRTFCNADHEWEIAESCLVCSAGACTGSCVPGAKQCSNTVAQTCSEDGVWETDETCEFVCSAGECTGSCTPGESDCNGDTPRTCNADGQWVEGSECPFLCTGSGTCTGECTPGGDDCPTLCTEDAECIGVCKPGTTECVGQTGTQTCSSNAQWEPTVGCPTSANEDSTCSAGVCGTTCQSGYADCTGAAGCESDLTALGTCGSCGTNCNTEPDHAAPICTEQGCDFVCDEGWGDVNGSAADGCEHDIYNDPENCGGAGINCYGGSCTDGVCEFEGIEEVALLQDISLFSMVEYEGYLYMITSGREILKLKADGTESYEVLATGYYPKTRNVFVVEGGEIFFVSDCTNVSLCSNDGIFKVSTSGGAVTQLSVHEPFTLDVENGFVYWNNGVEDSYDLCYGVSACTKTKFYRVPTTGGASTNIFTLDHTNYSKIKVVGSSLYYMRAGPFMDAANGYSSISFIEVDASTGVAIQSLGRITTSGSGLVTNPKTDWVFTENYIFVSGYETTGASDYFDTIFRIDLNGGVAVALDASTGSYSRQFAADDSYVYFADSAFLQRISINGGSATDIAQTYRGSPIAQDQDYVYWATWDSGESQSYILRLAK